LRSRPVHKVTMAKVYVQLVTIQNIPDKHGRLTQRHPGDWVEIGKHLARELLANGDAVVPDANEEREIVIGELDDCGILVRDGYAMEAAALAEKYELKTAGGDAALPFLRTLLWSPTLGLTPKQANLGFARVDGSEYSGWEMAAMLEGNRMLLCEVGSEADKKRTKEVVGDGRLPVYDVRALWVRRTPNTLRVVGAWVEEMKGGADERHAFARAVYTNPVRLCTLPHRWLMQWRTE
jgi:hypothetical protein